jgi:hypothetical protein
MTEIEAISMEKEKNKLKKEVMRELNNVCSEL